MRIKPQKFNCNQYKDFIYASFISLILLVIFSLLQCCNFCLLNLDEKWIIVSTLPIFIVLIVKGFIRKINTLGLEFELVKDSNIIENTIEKQIDYFDGLNKGSLNFIGTISDDIKSKIKSLRFIIENKKYNDVEIKRYFDELPCLKYLEIVDNSCNRFRYLIKKSTIISEKKNKIDENKIDDINIKKFINAVENNDFENYCVIICSDYILESDSLIDAYKKIRLSHQAKSLNQTNATLPVLDKNHIMVGTIDIHSLERKISEEYIKKQC